MDIIFDLNKFNNIDINKNKIKFGKESFPIKVTIINNKGKEIERLLYLRERNGTPKLILS